MRRMAEGIFRQYGSTMHLTVDGNRQQVRAFFQPVRSKSWQSMVNAATPLGEIPRGQYVYMGPAGVAVNIGDLLEIGGKQYLFRRVEPYYYGEEAVYLWGLCVEKGVNDTWGSQS